MEGNLHNCFWAKTRAFAVEKVCANCCKSQDKVVELPAWESLAFFFLLIVHKSIFLWKRALSDLFHSLDAEIKQLKSQIKSWEQNKQSETISHQIKFPGIICEFIETVFYVLLRDNCFVEEVMYRLRQDT